MIEIVYKENKEQANGNEGYFHLPKNIRQVGGSNGEEQDLSGRLCRNLSEKIFFRTRGTCRHAVRRI